MLTCKVTHCRDGTQQELRLLVPAALCGSIIGKGGATIRQFAEDSKAAIGLSPQVGSRESCVFQWSMAAEHERQSSRKALPARLQRCRSFLRGWRLNVRWPRDDCRWRKREPEEEGGRVYLRREMVCQGRVQSWSGAWMNARKHAPFQTWLSVLWPWIKFTLVCSVSHHNS